MREATALLFYGFNLEHPELDEDLDDQYVNGLADYEETVTAQVLRNIGRAGGVDDSVAKLKAYGLSVLVDGDDERAWAYVAIAGTVRRATHPKPEVISVFMPMAVDVEKLRDVAQAFGLSGQYESFNWHLLSLT